MTRSARPTVTEMRDMVQRAYEKWERIARSLDGATNPQTIVVRDRAQTRADTYYGILCVFHGDIILLKIDAE